LSEEAEGESASEEFAEPEIIIEVPVASGGSYLYICEQCGSELTEIPYYNRYYCEYCNLHY